ncbi:MAG: serine hydroxymethyltransferase [Patescibacteria group bacterium]|nr:serine hydroxymethyltransferase [Patescibacteria group bacterium]
MTTFLGKTDPEVQKILDLEAKRQKDGLEMIPSENYASPAVLEALGSIFTNKYAEGYPDKRYYGGNEYIDRLEKTAIERAKKLFGVPHANVQPYSGSPANFAVYFALLNPADVVMGHNLPDGGHLTHGWKVSVTGTYFKSVPYHVLPSGRIDFDEVEKLAKQHKPKLIWVGATAYPFEFEFEKFAKIADAVGAYLVADIAHVAGLVIAGAHKNPALYVDIITTTTHKTLRGPRGGMIMVTDKGLKKDPELAEKIDRAVFPGTQGGPHEHQIAALAVALKEDSSASFKKYGRQVVKNAKVLAKTLMANKLQLVGNGTENHMILMDLSKTYCPGAGYFAQYALEAAGITVNKNTVPAEPVSPFYPSGIRLGTPAITTRGMKEKEMVKIGNFIAQALKEIKPYRLPDDKNARIQFLKNFREEIYENKNLLEIKKEVEKLCKKFPVPGIK